jgi:cytochrome c553
MTLQAEIEKMADLSQVEQMFKTIRLCMDYIYDAEKMYASKDHTEQEMVDFLESLTDDQFQKISKFFETSPKLKHEVKLNCITPTKDKGKKKSVCGYSEDLTLEGLQSFFE